MAQTQHRRLYACSSSSQQDGSGQRMLYTGPDYIRDYRPKLPDFTSYIGEVMAPRESTGDVSYLCRAAPGTPSPLPKESYVGGIGWGVSDFSYLNRRQLLNSYQIKHGQFRKACEENTTHRYQNPWTPPPQVLDKSEYGARARLAWTEDNYDSFNIHGGEASRLQEHSIPGQV
ncbi:uncharacterized protein C4orf45 [Xenopus laevis]|uniref:Uncharacterized protein n=2 Tax=Xenopus laevis TaxID=8355 RepID=A0A974DXB6_XENLA|nr:uncharacterized protein C4orf45 [Xenopus laevis]OCT99658.1 hypothetical protein XELAEV_18005441mg [Xenopus laevis]